MDTFEAIRSRRSVKQYDPSFVMPPEHERQLLEAALLSPTSFNIQHWRFVVAKDPTVKKQLRAAAFNQAQVEEAQLTLVLCADLHAWDREPERYYREAPEKTRNYLVPMLRNLYRDNHQLMRDEAMRSVGIAAQTLMLAAKALGYDSGALVGFDPAKVAEVIRLPADHVIGMILVIGKRARDAHPRSGQLPLEEVLFVDRFPESPGRLP
jgi:nitroreductase